LPAEEGKGYLLQVGVSLASRDDALENFLATEAVLVPLSVVAVALLGSWMAGLALRPLQTAAAQAEEITAAQLDRRLPVRGANDEMDQLSAAFNGVLSRLEATIGEMKQFTASIAHELRTPLTVLRGEAEIALMQGRGEEDYRRVLSSQLEEFDKLTRMINQTLTLARAESGEIRLARSQVDFSGLAAGLVQDMQAVAYARGVDLESEIEPGIHLSGDAGWLERMLLNLMDNAIKFTAPNGRVSVHVSRDKGYAVLRVSDNGCGIAAEALPHIFDRFYRSDQSRSRADEGAGLGLTLVHWIVQQHQGAIEVESQTDRGSVFTIRLPLVDVVGRPLVEPVRRRRI
jgi:heavy metal sensor kinase